ncbi:Uncharacterized protein dnl_34320 [Desulfonema limicola]|uniref:Uncharacterized protein n=1 Tax=Desulfonema limicola TaxID=45656 RepID=A0A975B8Y6_9BACT|nr:hypothetical protein [Desulfonema limicola]QTA81106.1 Uncharacterized protein dnl_34320 [Desulfonema limicola]
MNQFNPEFFILLEDKEMEMLVSSKDRDKFQPDLKAFLYAVHNLKGLRNLELDCGLEEWNPPDFTENEKGEILDNKGNLRGYRQIIPLPARPGEAQMGLSYDWFWSEFSYFLHCKKVWAYKNNTEFVVISSDKINIEDEWNLFWDKISSKNALKQSLDIFLNNKTLFKSQAKPWDSKDIPVISEDMAAYLIYYYEHGKSRKMHFKQTSIPKAVADLESLIKDNQYEKIKLINHNTIDSVQGGDFNLGSKNIRCAACGEIIPKKEGLKRLAVFFKDSDERPQSASDKDKLSRFCKRCIATVFLCPVKLTPETLTVRFKMPDEFSLSGRTIETELKKFVAQSLDVHAGSFISLHINESIDRKPLNQVLGAYHYSLWKMAVTFMPELFAQNFGVEVYPGEERFTLPRWALWFVSSLASWDNVFQYNCYGKKDFRPHFSQFLRLVSRKKIFQAFYVLISGNLINNFYAQTWKINALQEIWSGFEKILKEDDMPIPDYPKIAGFAGLLLPLAERVQSSQKQENERKRAVSKLLEEVDRPIQYAYTAARETGSPDFIFCQRPKNRYFYEKALEILKFAGEDIEQLQKEAKEKAEELAEKDPKNFQWMKDAEQKIFICPDQIARVTSALVCEGKNPPYENEADWRSFAYQVKLALWSMFPGHLGSKE